MVSRPVSDRDPDPAPQLVRLGHVPEQAAAEAVEAECTTVISIRSVPEAPDRSQQKQNKIRGRLSAPWVYRNSFREGEPRHGMSPAAADGRQQVRSDLGWQVNIDVEVTNIRGMEHM
ncbi:hypothetical protein CDD83_7461 [Cordyceps sp. RAO-2017]|nr:hypothetical protein CDD83_7461 [Cordyceps sp. RAO-2017]